MSNSCHGSLLTFCMTVVNDFGRWRRSLAVPQFSALVLPPAPSNRSALSAPYTLISVTNFAKQMFSLPSELLHTIISLLVEHDLWVLVQVSRFFRQLALTALLLRYEVTDSQLYSGSISLSREAYFLIPMIHNIHPIRKLSIAPGKLQLTGVASVLDAVDIPDITLRGRLYAPSDTNTARMVTTSSRGGTDPVIIVASGAVNVSRHRHVAPTRFWRIPQVTPHSVADVLIGGIPFLIFVVAVGIVNSYLLLRWCYHRVLKPEWDRSARIAADLYWYGVEGDSMRIQIISGAGVPQFTLVTFPSLTLSYISIGRLPTLFPAQTSALLATLDLTDRLGSLRARRHSAFNFHALLGFINRHKLLTKLTLRSGAIDPVSLAEYPLPDHQGSITILASPALYIPYILPTQPSVTDLNITSAAHGPHLSQVLAAIGSNPESRVHTLTLHFKSSRLVRQILPWRANSDPEVETPVRGIRHIALLVRFKYGKTDALGLPRWLRRFPALLSVQFRGQSVPVASRVALAESILEGRVDGEWEGIYYHD